MNSLFRFALGKRVSSYFRKTGPGSFADTTTARQFTVRKKNAAVTGYFQPAQLGKPQPIGRRRRGL